jgi:hypothetical protein
MNKKLDWIKEDKYFPDIFIHSEGSDENKLDVSCQYSIIEKVGFEEPRIYILNTLNALTKEFSLYIQSTWNEESTAHDIPWWYNEAPLTGFLSAALVRQFDAIILQDFVAANSKRPDLWALLHDKSILLETKMGSDIKNAGDTYIAAFKNTYEMATDQVKMYLEDPVASADYWCVLYFSAREFGKLPDIQEINLETIEFPEWVKYNNSGLPFSCKFKIDPPKNAQCKNGANKGNYYPLCYLWGNIGRCPRIS